MRRLVVVLAGLVVVGLVALGVVAARVGQAAFLAAVVEGVEVVFVVEVLPVVVAVADAQGVVAA